MEVWAVLPALLAKNSSLIRFISVWLMQITSDVVGYGRGNWLTALMKRKDSVATLLVFLTFFLLYLSVLDIELVYTVQCGVWKCPTLFLWAI